METKRRVKGVLVVLIMMLVLQMVTETSAQVEPNLIAWWKFDETAGATATDSAGSHHGALIGDPNWISGVDNNALAFDNTGDGVHVPHHVDLNLGTGPFTLAGWICNENTPGSLYKRIITKREDPYVTAFYSLCLTGNKLSLELNDISSGPALFNAPPEIQGDGLWHHVACTRTEAGKIYFYIDGVQYHNEADVSLQDLSNTAILEIGNFWIEAFDGETFKGRMDDVRIYTGALEPNDIRYLAQQLQPHRASAPTPTHQATEVTLWPTLSWTPGSSALTHDVYLDTFNPPVTLVADDRTPATFDPCQLQSGATYFWKVNENAASGTIEGDIWQFTTTQSYQASGPSPVHEETEVTLWPTLSWTPGSGALTHDVYLDTVNPPVTLVADDHPSTTWSPTQLQSGVTYYWKVNENNALGTVEGDIWQFTTTESFQASGPSPVHEATEVSLWPTLGWIPGSGALTHDVYLDTVNPPVTLVANDHTLTTFDPCQLQSSVTYFWQVNENTASGTVEGDIWRFTTTNAYQASAPFPSNGQNFVSLDVILSWTSGADALSHDVYFGTLDPPITQIADDITTTSVDPCTLPLEYCQTYYWRVNENTPAGTVPGDVWQFTTFPWTGSGAQGDPYRIATARQLQLLSDNSTYWGPNIYFKLTNDITIPPGMTINPIGNDSITFDGNFDGVGHTITGLEQTGSMYVGLFGHTSGLARISNLSLAAATINGVSSTGILVGQNDGNISYCSAGGTVNGSGYFGGLVGANNGTISSCSATGTVNGTSYFGGLVGFNNWGGTINHCHAADTVSGGYNSSQLGGLVGYNYGGTISNCSAAGTVTGGVISFDLGGLVGYNLYGTISNCYANVPVTGGDGSYYLGGLVGWDFDTTISNCYATGAVVAGAGSTLLGGFAGENTNAAINNCYWDITTSGMTDGVGTQDPDPAGVSGKTTVEMKQKITFTSWDFDEIWLINNYSSYPILRQEEIIPGDLNKDGIVNLLDWALFCQHWLVGVEE